MFDDDDDWPSGVPIAGTALVIAVVVVGVLVVGGYADDLVDRYEGDPAPQASFDFRYDDRTETLVVEHAGGDTIDGRNLFVVAGNRSVGNFSVHETVESGDSIRVAGVERDEAVRVVWRRGERAVVVAERT